MTSSVEKDFFVRCLLVRHIMRKALLAMVIVLTIASCGQSGPPSINASSEEFTTLADKAAFLERYVRFRRHYQQLDFVVHYHNNSGGLVPGPSEWDIRIVAVVAPDELEAWTSGLDATASPDTTWLADVPTAIDHSATMRWFQKGGVMVGVDKVNSVVVYRNLAM